MAKGTSLFYRTLDPRLVMHHYNRYGKWLMPITLPVRVLTGVLVGAPMYVLSRLFLTLLNPWAWRDNPLKAGLTTLAFGGFAAGAYATWGTWTALSSTLNGVVMGLPGAFVVGVIGAFALATALVLAKTIARGYYAFTTRETFDMTNPKYTHTYQALPFKNENGQVNAYYQAMINQWNYRKAVKSAVLCYDIDELEERGFPNYGKSMSEPGKLMEELNYTKANEWLGNQKTALLSAYELSRYDGGPQSFTSDAIKRDATERFGKTKDAFLLANRGLGDDFYPISRDARLTFEDDFKTGCFKHPHRVKLLIK